MNAWNHTTDMDHLRRRSEDLIKKGKKSSSSSSASSQDDPRVESKKALYEDLGATSEAGPGGWVYKR
ncbi:hypothetical protein ACFL12_01440 [Pseudomonadota bacterium]